MDANTAQVLVEAALRMGAKVRLSPDGSIEISPGDCGAVARDVGRTADAERIGVTRSRHPNGARGAVIEAAQAVVRRSGNYLFSAQEILEELRQRGAPYADSTLRTMMSSQLCTEGIFTRHDRGQFALADTPAERVRRQGERVARGTALPSTRPEDLPEVDPDEGDIEVRAAMRDGAVRGRPPWAI